MKSEKLYGPLYGEDGEQLPGLEQLLQDVTIARDNTLSARDLAESLVEEARKEGGLEIEWRGETELRLRRLDGEWTMWHDLKGDPGKGLRGDPGRSLRGSQNEDGSVTVEEERTDGSWAEVGVISPPEPLDVESQVILPSGNTQVTMTSGASFEVQRGETGPSPTISGRHLDEDGNTVIEFSDGNEVTIEAGKSAYQAWLDLGNSGGPADFLASIKGEPGEPGPAGDISAHERLSYDGRTLSQQAEAGQTEPLERWFDPSGNDVSSLSAKGDVTHRSLSLDVPVQSTNTSNPNQYYTSDADLFWKANDRWEVRLESADLTGKDELNNNVDPQPLLFDNRFDTYLKDKSGSLIVKVIFPAPTDGAVKFCFQTLDKEAQYGTHSIRAGLIDTDGGLIEWGLRGVNEYATHVGNGLWVMEGGSADQNGHAGFVFDFQRDTTDGEQRIFGLQAFGTLRQIESATAAITKHSSPRIVTRWQFGENVALGPDGFEMRDEATGDWTPITLSNGQLQIG